MDYVFQPLLVLDLVGTFAFAVNGALTATRVARLDVFGIVTLGMITALGGGIIRDVLLGNLPPTTFSDWRYLTVALAGGLVAALVGRRLDRLAPLITVLDAAGLGLFAVTGTGLALRYGVGVEQAVLLGMTTAIGGGTLRDVLLGRLPEVLHTGLYAIPALLAAAIVVTANRWSSEPGWFEILAALLCFGIRMADVRLNLNAPGPRKGSRRDGRRNGLRSDH
ncbi:MAG TPA: trimeric intracellular cation channel family protein [Propionibacteriaceae bacterium]